MRIINKSLFVVLSSLSVMASAATTTNSSPYLYEKLYRLAEKMYYTEYSLNAEQQRIVDALATQIDTVISLPNDITCGTINDVFKEAYRWSYSYEGLNELSSEAEKFATQITAKFCPAAYLGVYKAAYKFAYTGEGMNKLKSEAKRLATTISDFEASTYYSKNTLQCYVDNYTFAYSRDGMNKTRSEAEKYANKLCLGQ
ncbi:hypothetical protein BN59_02056 [Legionella massiliensis]|uniref:Uncharacterized protein n=1 Tax=Legionella massiliensis TaxID=1034943 RepID=A0A078KXR7_9GAMM|nr:hypothetical protein [Legionella massiliensis]CDZ77766.1 hypothetical protein BN59_02056 [Legionella massiliensis]CEE13504.1 hypothetical protein BN1094_02056 [Legionella massiliensis]